MVLRQPHNSPPRAARVLVIAAIVGTVAAPARAQGVSPPRADRRGAITLSAGLGGALANTLSGHCGTTGSGVVSAGLRWRVGRIALVDGTTSLAEGISTNDCLFGAPFQTPSGDVRSIAYARDPNDGALATALRAGVEGGLGPARLRVLGGVGRMWRPGVTFGTAAVAASVGPRFGRLLVEFEGWQYKLPVVDRTVQLAGGQAGGGSTSRRRVRERTAFLRLGLDVPVGPRR